MAQGRSLLKEIFKNFINSFIPKSHSGKLIGKDYNGTEYYESTQRIHGRTRRWYVPVDLNEPVSDLPPEWTAWLRHKRKFPPTEEEIKLTLEKVQMYIDKAKNENKKTETETVKNVRAFPKYEEYDTGPDDGEGKKNSS